MPWRGTSSSRKAAWSLRAFFFWFKSRCRLRFHGSGWDCMGLLLDWFGLFFLLVDFRPAISIFWGYQLKKPGQLKHDHWEWYLLIFIAKTLGLTILQPLFIPGIIKNTRFYPGLVQNKAVDSKIETPPERCLKTLCSFQVSCWSFRKSKHN